MKYLKIAFVIVLILSSFFAFSQHRRSYPYFASPQISELAPLDTFKIRMLIWPHIADSSISLIVKFGYQVNAKDSSESKFYDFNWNLICDYEIYFKESYSWNLFPNK